MKLLITLTVLLLTVGCASAPPSATLKTMTILGVRETQDTLPDNWLIKGDSHAKQLENLTGWVKRRGLRLGFVPVLTSAENTPLFGVMNRQPNGTVIILISNQYPKNMQLYTLAHEVSHAYEAMNLTAAAGEVFAELSALQACQRVGLDATGQSAKYLKSWPIPLELQWKAAWTFHREVDVMVMMLTEAMKGAN